MDQDLMMKKIVEVVIWAMGGSSQAGLPSYNTGGEVIAAQ